MPLPTYDDVLAAAARIAPHAHATPVLRSRALDALAGGEGSTQTPQGEERFVKIRCQSQNGQMLVSVQDNGKGMSPEVLRHIFEPFYSTKKDKGTGLGMFITYGIVRKLGGEIHVQSEEGRGSTISITLPLTPPDVAVEV